MVKKVLITAIAVFLICSCQTQPVAWDDSIPEERMATVRFVSMTINSFNGIAVTKFNWVKIPAGEATLGGEVSINHAGIRFHLPEMEFTWRFEADREYIVQGGSRNMLWGVYIFETSKYSQISEENMAAFVPFKNQP